MKFHSQSSASDIHDIFPLAPFLTSLATIDIHPTLRDYERISRVLRTGGRWDMERLRFTLVALLVRNSDQEIDFRRRFDSFFQESQAEADLETIDLNRALKELRQLSKGRITQEGSLPRRAPTQKKPVSFNPTNYKPIPEPGWQDDYEFAPIPAEVEEKPEVHEEPSVPAQTAESTPQSSNPPAEDYSRFPFGFAVCNGEVIGKTFELPDAEAPIWNEDLPRLFRPGTIGGKPAPRLDNETLDQLADSLGYFQSEQVGDRLDVPASIRATAGGGGFPNLMFQRRKQIRSVLILEDIALLYRL